MGAIDLRKILGFLSQPNVMKTWLWTFSNQNTFFLQTNITSLIQFRMFFSKSENEVWMELKPDSCCCKNLKDYYSRKCTLNQSNEKVLQFFHNKWHEKCSNSKVYIWFFYRKRWFKWLFLTSIDRKGSNISDV